MKIYLLGLIICGLIFQSSIFIEDNRHRAYVPNEETAKKIAEAVWIPIYGEQIYEQRPYTAVLIGDSVWYVSGSLGKSYVDTNTAGDTIAMHIIHGGVAQIYLNKYDGKILSVSHSK